MTQELRTSDLTGTDLTGTDLTGTDLTGNGLAEPGAAGPAWFGPGQSTRGPFLRSRWQSFRFAWAGAVYTLRTQPNAWIEIAAAVVIFALALFFRVRAVEWAVLALTIALVFALEAVNTAVEAMVDLVTPEYHPLAKVAKDAAAGAMIFIVIGAICVALAIFGPRLLALAGGSL